MARNYLWLQAGVQMTDCVLTLDGLRLHASQNEVRMKVRRKEQLKNN